MMINQAMDVIKRELDNVPAIALREFLDDLCGQYRNVRVRFDYDDQEPTYHNFFSEAGAREAISNFFADGYGSECLLMIIGEEDELVKAVRI